MSGYKTPEAARINWLCPNGRIMTPTTTGCIGPNCAAWRWRALQASDPAFKSAISKRMKELKGDHKQAVADVMKLRADLGLPTEPFEGWCGLGGEVQA